MRMKTTLCAAALAATLGMATDALAAVGEPSGSYGISGKNHGQTDGGFGVGTFGYDLLYGADYILPPDLTGDDQLGPGGGAPVPLTFDGVAETFGNLEFNESHQIYDGSGIGLYSDFYGIPKATPLPLPLGWNTPAHLVELSIKDTLGGANAGGGTLEESLFTSSVTRYDGITLDGTTGGPNAAVPVFPADRGPEDPALAPYGLDGRWVGSYFYFKKDGLPVNPAGANFSNAVLGAAHPNIPGQEMFMIIFQYEYWDTYHTADIGPGTFGASWDLSPFGAGLNFINLAGLNDIADAGDIDEVVMGWIYRMIADSDGNEDGKVDGLDYLKWASAFGTDPVLNPASPDTIVPAPGRTFNQSLGDYNSDGKVDGLDYLRWASEFGFVGDGSDMLPLATTVPEPCSLALACFALASMGLSIRRRR